MTKMNWTLSAALLAASCLVSTPQAKAQQPSMGKFTLPVEAQFGGKILEPGQYEIYRVVGMNAIRITGEGGTATMLASSVDIHAPSAKGKITLINVGGNYAVRQFDTGLGGRFEFVPWKSAKHSERAAMVQPSTLDVPTR